MPSKKISNPLGLRPRKIRAGTVKITPAARDSPVEAIV